MKAEKSQYEYKPLIKDIGFSKATLNHDGPYLARDYPDVTPVTPQGVSQGCQQGRIILIDMCHLDKTWQLIQLFNKTQIWRSICDILKKKRTRMFW